jgi:pimeloyl-ACP methyl ester carboxylesterase
MMRSPRLVERVLSAVRRALGDAKIHVFGISMNALRRVFR